ncbi:MAG: hypothetical protein HRU15_07715 [Planctomycetes bacterium]|nr:hypothetical protein [Planctomycetota bacterium]
MNIPSEQSGNSQRSGKNPTELPVDLDHLVERFLEGPDFIALQNQKEKRRRTRERNKQKPDPTDEPIDGANGPSTA